jgi:hypothetical protein
MIALLTVFASFGLLVYGTLRYLPRFLVWVEAHGPLPEDN